MNKITAKQDSQLDLHTYGEQANLIRLVRCTLGHERLDHFNTSSEAGAPQQRISNLIIKINSNVVVKHLIHSIQYISLSRFLKFDGKKIYNLNEKKKKKKKKKIR